MIDVFVRERDIYNFRVDNNTSLLKNVYLSCQCHVCDLYSFLSYVRMMVKSNQVHWVESKVYIRITSAMVVGVCNGFFGL